MSYAPEEQVEHDASALALALALTSYSAWYSAVLAPAIFALAEHHHWHWHSHSHSTVHGTVQYSHSLESNGIFALTEHHLYADIASIKRQRDLANIISAF